jgi:hypothetical protein
MMASVVELAAHVHHELDLRADRLTYRRDPGDREVGSLAADRALRDMADHAVGIVGDRICQRIELEGGIAVAQRPLGRRREFRGRRGAERPAIGVEPHALARFPAEQLVNRELQRLPLDVPERHLDGADAREHDRPASLRPEAVVVHVAPDRLDPEGVLAPHDVLEEVLDHAGRRGLAHPIGDRGLAEPGDTVVGAQLHHNGVPPIDARNIDAGRGEFHRRIPGTGRIGRAWPLPEQPRQRKILMASGSQPISMRGS